MEDETSEETAAPIWVPVKELLKSALEWSTVKKGDLQGKGRPRLECLFCGAVYTGGPSDIRLHLDVFGSGTGGKKCGTFHGKPVKPEMKERKREVKEELDRRAKKEDEHAKQVQKVEQAKAVAMEGQSTLDKYKTTPEMCDEAFAKAAASAGLPLNLVDNQHFRTFLAKVATCGSKFLKGHDDAQLSHSKKLTEKVLPKADEDIDKQARGPVDAMAADLGGAMVSDGWSDVCKRAFFNCLFVNPGGSYHITTMDCKGMKKGAEFVASFMIDSIRDFGPDKVTAVITDGACESAFEAIVKEFPRIVCIICPAHSIDNFIKNVMSDKVTIQVRGEEKITWGENLFHDATEKVCALQPYYHHHQLLLL
jgi:hypothetical protein